MSVKSPDRTGVLIVRQWIETSQETGLRARITQAFGTKDDERSTAVASTAEDICAIIEQWVEAFAAQGSDTSDVESIDEGAG